MSRKKIGATRAQLNSLDRKITKVLSAIKKAKEKGRPTKSLENKLETLIEQRDIMTGGRVQQSIIMTKKTMDKFSSSPVLAQNILNMSTPDAAGKAYAEILKKSTKKPAALCRYLLSLPLEAENRTIIEKTLKYLREENE